MQNHKPVLTISLLISNRPDTIPRCLDSLKPIMEAIPSELILIDTSKNAEIHTMLLGYTEKVYEFEWCQDFAKARNEGLKRAEGEWFLYLDDDEWFVECEELIAFFQSGEYKEYGYADYIVHNFSDKEYTKYTEAWVSRLFRIEKDTIFVGAVHETFQPVATPEKYLNVVVNHSGYVFETKEQIQKHFERNSRILLKVIEEDPHNLRWQAQMVQEYCSIKDWDAIIEFCQKHISKVKEFRTAMDRNHLATLLGGWVEALLFSERYEETISAGKQVLKDERSTELLKALCYLRMSEAYVELNEWKPAKKYAERYLDCYKKLPKNKEQMRLDSNSLVVKMAFTDHNIIAGYSMLICSDLKLGNIKALETYYEHLGWKDKEPVLYAKLGKSLIECMAGMKYYPIFGRMIADACERDVLRNFLFAEVQRIEEEDKSAFRKLAYTFGKADKDYWFIWYCRIIYADAQHDIKNVETALEGLLCAVENVFHLPEKVDEIIDKYDLKIALLWEKTIKEQWEKQITTYIVQFDDAHISMTRVRLYDVFPSDDWKVLSFELAVMEKKIVMGPIDLLNIQEYYDVLKSYAELKPIYYQRRHLEVEAIENLKMVPTDVQAAVKIKEYMDLETQDKMQALGKLKEAVEVCRVFAEGIGKFMHLYTEFERQRADKQKKEMQQLRNQVMEQVKVMVANGQDEAALQIIQQLKQMFPGDLEIIELGLELRLQSLG